MAICIDSEFKSLIPPLTADEYAGLEKSLLEEGCRDALVLWGDTLIDGHNRYEICTKYHIPFETVKKDFDDRQDTIRWIILNQFGRRNLPAHERARLVLRLKPVIAEKAKENLVTHTETGYQGCQKSDKAVIILEYKYSDAEMPDGQKKALIRIADDIQKAGKRSVVFLCQHNVDDCEKDIDAASSIVREYYFAGKWYQDRNTP